MITSENERFHTRMQTESPTNHLSLLKKKKKFVINCYYFVIFSILI